jgi:hypothetical protein
LINQHRQNQFNFYNATRQKLIADPTILIRLEEYLTNIVFAIIKANLAEIKRDYNEASHLYPFWENYPPEDRGRSPIADQYPWIEVGEHAIGTKLSRFLSTQFALKDTGLPTGSDQRFVLSSPAIKQLTKGLTDSVWLFVDIKSIGPRDDQDHTVMSHNQVSGDGLWRTPAEGVKNSILTAKGQRASHDFHCSLPPLFVLSDGTIAPLINLALKPVYRMLPAKVANARNEGQPLERIDLACIPNGLLLTTAPNYLATFPGLLFPGKDDKSKDPRKLRARVSFEILRTLASWRVQKLPVTYP